MLIKSKSGSYIFQQTFACSESIIRNTRLRREICSKLTIKTSERRHGRRSGTSVVNTSFSSVSIVTLNN